MLLGAKNSFHIEKKSSRFLVGKWKHFGGEQNVIQTNSKIGLWHNYINKKQGNTMSTNKWHKCEPQIELMNFEPTS